MNLRSGIFRQIWVSRVCPSARQFFGLLEDCSMSREFESNGDKARPTDPAASGRGRSAEYWKVQVFDQSCRLLSEYIVLIMYNTGEVCV